MGERPGWPYDAHAGSVRHTEPTTGSSLSLLVAPERVDARTSDAGIRVTVPANSGPYAVQQHTSDAKTSIRVRTDPAAARKLVLRTSNGDIVVASAGR